MTDEDGAVFLDVNTNVLDKQLRSASDASFNPPALQASPSPYTLNPRPYLNSVIYVYMSIYKRRTPKP